LRAETKAADWAACSVEMWAGEMVGQKVLAMVACSVGRLAALSAA